MTNTSAKFYIENLSLFSQALRENGVESGIKETMDAAHIIEIMGLADKKLLRYALCSVYAKSVREQRIFYETFDNFFVGKDIQYKQVEKKRKAKEQEEQQYKEAIEELKYEDQPLNLPDEMKDAYAKLPPMTREQIMRYLNVSTSNMRVSPYVEKFMIKTIEQRLHTADMQLEGSSGSVSGDMGDLLYKNLSDITEEEIPKIISLIQLLVKKINGAVSRDFHRTGKSGPLDYRATIHESLRSSGSFYKLLYKKRRKSRKRIVLLCDVSGSMLKFTQFAIQFIKSMSDVSKSSETYLFSEEFQKVSPFVLSNMRTFENYVKDSGLWGKGTDIGKAVGELVKVSSSHLSASTILIILSDTKTMSPDTAGESFKKVAKRVGRVIWMNPIPEGKWDNMKTASIFRPYCQMVDCSTLNNLAKACMKLV